MANKKLEDELQDFLHCSSLYQYRVNENTCLIHIVKWNLESPYSTPEITKNIILYFEDIQSLKIENIELDEDEKLTYPIDSIYIRDIMDLGCASDWDYHFFLFALDGNFLIDAASISVIEINQFEPSVSEKAFRKKAIAQFEQLMPTAMLKSGYEEYQPPAQKAADWHTDLS